MIAISRNVLVCIPVSILLSSCGLKQSSEATVQQSEVPSALSDTARLGQSYDTEARRFQNLICVSGTEDSETGNNEATFRVVQDMSMSEVLDQLSGGLSIGVDFPAVRAGASANIAKRLSSTELSNTYTINWEITPHKKVLVPGTYGLTADGKKYAEFRETKPEILRARCGDEFVKEMKLGGSLMVNMKIDYANKQDKFKVSGKIKADIAGVVNAEGSLESIDDETKQRVFITIEAIQKGGQPLELTKILPNNLMQCTLDNFKPCFDVFNEAIQYTKQNLPNQFADGKNYNIIRYKTERYDDSGLDQLVPKLQSHYDKTVVRLAQSELDERYKQALQDVESAATIRKRFAQYLTDEQLAALADFQAKAQKNTEILATAATACLDNPNQKCIDLREPTIQSLKVYDRKVLSLSLDENLNARRCEAAIQMAVRIGDISEHTANVYRRKKWAPIFANPAHPSHGIAEWTDCTEAVKTYVN